MKQTQIIAGFPGVGKSYFKNNSGLSVLDSDSSTFDKAHFPQNYIEHIKENIGKVDIILISTHELVRKALVENDLRFTLVYPTFNQIVAYKKRYIERGSPQKLIDIIVDNWDEWLDDLSLQTNCTHIVLPPRKTLSDFVK